ncbi:hypothetical protein ND991_20450 [Gordonia sputi]|uniref:hypothetical protein n=1 Tax=Gordonia sputi TaxID=36823 RepID=UPI0020434134|nr:hypothetical protein [Gordonia sputi]MCM3897580.1 hypothetical protein [Gordonia sputi]
MAAGRSRTGTKWLVRVTAATTLCSVFAAGATGNGTAAVVATQAAHQQQVATQAAQIKVKPTTRPAETYDERLDRIGKSKRSLLATPKENLGKETSCVSAEFTSLSVVYDSLFESILPSLPPQLKQNAYAARTQAHRDMDHMNVSTLAISDNPLALGADSDDPATKYRSPISQWIVVQLLKVRDGKQNEAIPVSRITLMQAVETAWLYLFTTVVAPAKVLSQIAPISGSPLTGTQLDALKDFITWKSLLQIGVSASALGAQYTYQAIASSMINQCVARVTKEQKDDAGRPSETVRYNIPIPAIVQDIADQLALADNKTCAPVGSLPLSRIVTRTSDYAQTMVTTEAQKRNIRNETKRILSTMRSTPIPHNLIPADPADFNTAESIASYIGTIIPYVGGAPLDIALGLGHNIGQGDNLAATVPLSDLTVTKGMTAAYYSLYLSLHLFATAGGLVEGEVLPEGLPLTPVRLLNAAGSAAITYGLVNYHNVIRSMCLREDDTTGTGLGAEQNKKLRDARDGARTDKTDTEKTAAEKSVKPDTPTTSPSTPAGEDRRRATAPSTAPSTKPAITPVPGLPFTIPAAG